MTRRRSVRVIGLACALALTSTLGACDWFDWLGTSKTKTPLPGKRIAVLQSTRDFEPDARLADEPVKLPRPQRNADWPQAGGYPDHVMFHLELPDKLTRAWSVSIGAGTAEVMVADGLGHGPDAAIAADAALAAFDRPRASGPSRFVEQAHAALRGTRGAAIAIAQLDANASRIRFAGAGNVIGRILSGVADRTLLTQNGTAGVQLRTHVQEQEMEWPAHALLLVCSDGVQSRWQLEERSLLQRDPALVAAFVIWKFCRGRDDATVVVIRRAES